MLKSEMNDSNTRASQVSGVAPIGAETDVSRDVNAHKRFLDTPTLGVGTRNARFLTPTLRVDTRNARFLQSRINVTCTLIFLFSISYITARRDPFTCPLQQQKKELVTIPQKAEKKSDETSQIQWQVQEIRKDTVVLKDAQGNIREISFEETQK